MAETSRLTGYIFDALLELEDGAAAITADGVGSGIVDLGASVHVTGDIVLDISAMTVGGAAEENYNIIAEVSDSPTFASGIENAGAIEIGSFATTVIGNRDVESDPGRYVLQFQNQLNTRVYRYLRLFFDVTGTSPSITLVAYLSKSKDSGGS